MNTTRPPHPPTDFTTTVPVHAGPADPLSGERVDFFSELRTIAVSGQVGSLAIELLLDTAKRHADASYVALLQIEGDSLLSLASAGEMLHDGQQVNMEDIARICLASRQADRIVIARLAAQRDTSIAIAPLPSASGAYTTLVAILPTNPRSIAMRVAIVERVAAAIEQVRMRESLTQLDWEALACAGAAELVSRVMQSDSLIAASFQLVNDLHQFLECAQVALGTNQTQEIGCRIQAISGLAEFDHHAPSVAEIAATMDECLIRKASTVWPPLQVNQRHATLAHRRVTGSGKHEAIMTVPLMLSDQRIMAVLWIAGRRQTIHDARTQGAMRAMAPHLAAAIDARIRLEPGRWTRLSQYVVGKSADRQRRWLLAIAAILIVLSPMTPWPHRVATNCQLQPRVRRFTVAPYEGILKATFAKPGQLVTKGQPLARMDDRELRLELSSTIAERGLATTKRDKAMNEHDRSEAKLAQLEVERADLKIELLRNREQQLIISSPLDGVVLAGDLDGTEGTPVRVGQTLFEIGPLDPIRMELDIAEADLRSVAEGQMVSAWLDGFPSDIVQGKLLKIHPRAEVREGSNVFVAEVELANRDGLLRPGMSGTARIATGWKPLGWIWFHKAWNHTRQWIGI